MYDILQLHTGESKIHTDGSVSEIYSPPRVAPLAAAAGYPSGVSLDLTTGWDFDCESDRRRARKLLNDKKPLLLIGSPMCTWFSSLMEWNKSKIPSDQFQVNLRRAIRHLEFTFQLYDLQVTGGRYFLREHPAGATSWRQKRVLDFMTFTL